MRFRVLCGASTLLKAPTTEGYKREAIDKLWFMGLFCVYGIFDESAVQHFLLLLSSGPDMRKKMCECRGQSTIQCIV